MKALRPLTASLMLLTSCLLISNTTLAKTTLKLSHNQDKSHAVHKALSYLADKTKEYSNGELVIRIYPNATLGNERESLELMNSAGKLLPFVKNVIAVSSGKGGVGKSTVAANLAVALAKLGYKVGLLDADIFGPSVPKMFQVEDARPYAEQIDGRDLIIPIEKYGIKLLSIGFFVDPDQATLWRGGMASNALKQLIGDADWGELDYFILDTPPGTSDIHLTLVQTLAITGAVIVSTPQQVALADARKGINMYTNDKVNVPILGLVENMSWFTPAELPENKYFIFGKEGAKQLAEEMNVPLLGQIPIVQSICENGDKGTPAALNENSITGRAFIELAENVVKQTEKRNAEQAPTHIVEMKK